MDLEETSMKTFILSSIALIMLVLATACGGGNPIIIDPDTGVGPYKFPEQSQEIKDYVSGRGHSQMDWDANDYKVNDSNREYCGTCHWI